jgi:hypothetical protein
MEPFKFKITQAEKKVKPPGKFTITLRLEGKLGIAFQEYVAKCQEYCTLNNAEVARQMIEFCLRNINLDVPVSVDDPVHGSTHQENFSISTQPGDG